MVEEVWIGEVEGSPFTINHEKIKKVKLALAHWNRKALGIVSKTLPH